MMMISLTQLVVATLLNREKLCVANRPQNARIVFSAPLPLNEREKDRETQFYGHGISCQIDPMIEGRSVGVGRRLS